MSFSDTTPRQRWSRRQAFCLTPKGEESERSYQSSIVASRTEPGRASFDSARTLWAETLGVHSDDGIYLSEVRDEPMRMEQLLCSLEACGKTRKDVREAVERLVDAGLLHAVELPGRG